MLFPAFRTSRLGLGGFVVLLGLSFSGSALGAEVAITENARRHFTAGVNYLQDPDGARYEEAYREFRAAYADSASWKILGNLGLCAMKLERDGEAIQAYGEYLRQGGKDIEADERAQIQRDLETLQAGVVTVTIETVPPGAMVRDERQTARGDRVVNLYGPVNAPMQLGLRAGHHMVRVSLAGYVDETWEFDARPGTTEVRTFRLQQPKAAATAPGPVTSGGTTAVLTTPMTPTRPVPTGVYIGLAATGVLAAGGTVAGILASSKHSEFEDANDGSDPSRAEDLKESGETLNLVTDVLFGGAILAAGVTTVLYLTRPTHEEPPQAAYSLVPVAGTRGAGLVLSRRF